MALESPLSPLDGRYAPLVADLAESFSEATLNRTRLEVEIEWLIALTDHGIAGSAALSDAQKKALRGRVERFPQTMWRPSRRSKPLPNTT